MGLLFMIIIAIGAATTIATTPASLTLMAMTLNKNTLLLCEVDW